MKPTHREVIEDIYLHVKSEVENEKKEHWFPFDVQANEKHYTMGR